MSAKVLIIGGGSREHALTWKILQSEEVEHVFVCPGNAGTHLLDNVTNLNLPIDKHDMIADWCNENTIALVVVGPEVPLADGITDVLKSKGIFCFGPTKLAARIESSKSFSKQFMDEHGIPTAKWQAFTDSAHAINFINNCGFAGIVVKASGLAAGKGVVVATNKDEAIQAVHEIMEVKRFGEAGGTVVIEERLDGEEISVFAFSDGETFVAFPPAQDFKRAYNEDKGPNTGGMGAYCPVQHVTTDTLQRIDVEVIKKTVEGMKNKGCPFVGLLYVGLMLTKDGPKVLEYNCRFGDPETQVVLPLLKTDLYLTMKACCNGTLSSCSPSFAEDKCAVTIVLASGGYPGSYKKGMVMNGLHLIKDLPNVLLFHAGTKYADEQILTNGGRVLSVTGVGGNIKESRKRAYDALAKISFTDMQYRTDIALKALGNARSISYFDAGVDIDAGAALVNAIKPLAIATTRSGCMSGLGGFGAMFDLKAAGYEDPILVSGTDGVGTKLRVAHECSDHSSVGIDLVAMCVNDILAQGAEPLFFLDYYACGKLDNNAAKQLITGIAEGCVLAGCALSGGETAEMPGMYEKGVYDVAGFAVGAVDRNSILPKTSLIQAGDTVIGLASSGVHSNGFSLVRKIVELSSLKYSDRCPYLKSDISLGQALLTPTKIYVKAVLPLIKNGFVKAFAHITGGGLVENIPRVLPPNLNCLMDAHSWQLPSVFGWLAAVADISPDEMLRTFNCGLGGVLIVDSQNAETVLSRLSDAGEKASAVGILTPAVLGKPRVDVKGFPLVLEMSAKELISTQPATKKLKKDRMKVGVLISGSGTNLQALIDRSLKGESSAEIALVISNIDDAYGLQRARNAGIPTKVINHKNFKKRYDFDMELLSTLKSTGVELVCLAGFMRILTGEFVREWPGRLINIHPSILPSFKGMDAHEQVLEAGVRITGCTAHFVVEEVDAGGIIVQECVPVLPDDTVVTLQERVKLKEWEVFPKAMELVASGKVNVVDGLVVFT